MLGFPKDFRMSGNDAALRWHKGLAKSLTNWELFLPALPVFLGAVCRFLGSHSILPWALLLHGHCYLHLPALLRQLHRNPVYTQFRISSVGCCQILLTCSWLPYSKSAIQCQISCLCLGHFSSWLAVCFPYLLLPHFSSTKLRLTQTMIFWCHTVLLWDSSAPLSRAWKPFRKTLETGFKLDTEALCEIWDVTNERTGHCWFEPIFTMLKKTFPHENNLSSFVSPQ